MVSQAAGTARSTVQAFLIADIRGYTTYTRTHGDEAAARLAAAFAELAREGVEAHDGAVIELRGDEVLATFDSPRQALRAALELQAVLADEASLNGEGPLIVGIGLDIGEAVPVEGGYRGDALNMAARLCSAAAGGETLISESMQRVVGEMSGLQLDEFDSLTVKGIDKPIRGARALSTLPALEIRPARPDGGGAIPVELDPLTPLFGRDIEARRLRWAWRRARQGQGTSAVITGPTGIGKTRLAAEPALLAARSGAWIAYGSALTAGLAAALQRGTDSGPGVIVVDDLESASDDDLAAVRAASSNLPAQPVLLIVASTDGARPEVAALLRALSGPAVEMRLGPLDEAAVGAIVSTYARGADDPPPVRAIADASAGRPAVVHELAADWARQETGRRLGDAVERTVLGRRDLRQLESEVASKVVDLQLARTRLKGTARRGSLGNDICPFMGLAAFNVADAELYFGRERLVAEMIGRLAGSTFLGVVGPSGSGKSSAVRAGLIPALASGALPGAVEWTRVLLRPGSHPVAELDRVLYAALPVELRDRYTTSLGEQATADSLAAAGSLLPPAARPLVVIDQFEELFTATTDEQERDRFVAILERAGREGYATVVVAIRADFYGRCANYPVLAELLSEGHVLVGPMSASEYQRAIEGPARRAGLAVDSALVEALVDEVIEQPGALPLLSTALVELWALREGRAIRLSAYAATGGVRGAVARLAESAFGLLDSDQQQIARGLFLRLAAGEGSAVVRRRVSLAELDAVENPRVAEVVHALTDARLLTVDEGSIEVAHEALLREWPRLAEWLEEDRAGRQLREHLISSAREWQARNRDAGELYRGARLSTAIDWTTDRTLELTETERSFLNESRQAAALEGERQRRTNRRLRAFLAVAGVALVVALGAGALAYVQGQAAAKSATVADAQRLGAEALIQSNLDVSLLLARQGVELDDNAVTRAYLLSAIVRSPAAIGAWRPVSGRLIAVMASPDGRHLLVRNNEDNVFLIDSASGRLVRDLGQGWLAWFASDGSIVQASGRSSLGTSHLAISGVDEPTPHLTIPLKASWALSADARTLSQIDDDLRGITLTDTESQLMVGHIAAPSNTIFLDVWQYGAGGVLGVVHDGIPATDADLDAAYRGPVLLEWWPAGARQPSTAITAPSFQDTLWAVDAAATEIAVPEVGDSIGIYDLPSGQRRDFTMHHNYINGLAFSPDGSVLVTAGQDKLLQVWDAASGELRDTLAGHAAKVFAPAISDAGGHLTAWSVGADSQLIEWDLAGDRRINRPLVLSPGGANEDRRDHPNLAMAVSPDGRLVAATGGGGNVDVFDAVTLASVQHLQALPSGAMAWAVAFSPDSETLAVSGQGDSMIATWDTTSWTNTGIPWAGPPTTRSLPSDSPAGTPAEPNNIATVAWSPDGHLLAGGTADGGIYLWDAKTGANVRTLTIAGDVYNIAFSPDSGSIVATYASADPLAGRAAVWSLADGTLRYDVSVDDDYGLPFAATFSHDGKLLATAGGKGQIRFWDAATGTQTGPPAFGDAGWVESLSFSPDDSVLVAAGTDGTVRLIDPVGRRQLGSSLPGGDSGSIAAVGPDGRVFVGYGDTRRAYAWDISLPSLEAHACSLAQRTLTQAEWDQYLPTRAYQPACSGQ